mmetsp:Transcript_14764/g.19372  ORF Transcript_14764/g.19372 Transcript_14764/m.19372 type:complete len:121 (+) Transcript_14764:202-564(+)
MALVLRHQLIGAQKYIRGLGTTSAKVKQSKARQWPPTHFEKLQTLKNQRRYRDALQLFDKVSQRFYPGIDEYNVILSIFKETTQRNSSLQLLDEMYKGNVIPNKDTYFHSSKALKKVIPS